ncbi:hypothetical protein MNEG_13741 [Monoraphidium neglectum]|uniref:Uncharacterized protein n=1 Tax=Monoraphidium neglectum TaxID=145388 RepID=A0A0D2LXL1_9CHLO|nr:hypothetical protein MNEG_13741 [Monoraphidium neglectum]KIY94221.1 hypothetical protein MNEG_13741 [Monoraphidium neglectum]|eukprot:XP_013893241.1 hypothetical protein MNEG_13741 [Monoraphidium neglectum]
MLPSPAARLSCLLMHWALLPQLASAALPALPAPMLRELVLVAAAAEGSADQEGELGRDKAAAAAAAAAAADDDILVSSVADEDAFADEPSVADPLWMGLERINPSAFAEIIISVDTAATSAAAAAAASPDAAAAAPSAHAAVDAVCEAIVSGLRPAAPAALLLGAAVASAAPGVRASRLLRHLLRAAAGRGSVSLGDGVAHALWLVCTSPSADETVRRTYAEAAAALLAGLPPAEAARAASDMMAACAAAGDGAGAAAALELCEAALVAAAERADPELAFALLGAPAVLESAWEAVWAVVVNPVRGTFCPSARGLAGALSEIPVADSRRLAGAWGALVAHGGWAEVATEVRAQGQSDDASVDSGCGRGVPIEEVLSAVLLRLPLAAGAAHLAALAGQVSPSALARLASAAYASLEAAPVAAAAPKSSGAAAWLMAAGGLELSHPVLAAEPRALRVLCVAATALQDDDLPAFLPAAAAAADAERRRRDAGPALQLLYACAAEGRGGDGFQGLLRRMAEALPAQHARAMLAALGPQMTPATRAAVEGAADAEGRLRGEAVWQMGQGGGGGGKTNPEAPEPASAPAAPAPAAALVGAADAPAAPRAVAAAPASAAEAAAFPAVANLARLISSVPHAAPAGSGGSEDALQDPQRVAGLLRRIMALLSDPAWTPGRPEAAAAAEQLALLALRRAWGDGDVAGLVCRLPAPTALRLLMVAGAASGGLAARRPALLSALARWHGAGAVAGELAAIYESDRSFPLGDVCALLADGRAALSGAPGVDASSGGFIAAVCAVLGSLRGVAPPGAGAARYTRGYAAALVKGGEEELTEDAAAAAAAPAGLEIAPAAASRGPVTAGEFAELCCLLHALAPAQPARALLSALGASLGAARLAAVDAALPGAARRAVAKGAAMALEVGALLRGDEGGGADGDVITEGGPGGAAGPHGARAGGKLQAAAASGGGGGGAQAGGAGEALLAAAASGGGSGECEEDGGEVEGEGEGVGAHSERAQAALLAAAESGGTRGGPQAACAEAALLAAAGDSAAAADSPAGDASAATAATTEDGPDRAVLQLLEIGALVHAVPSADPRPFLRRALRGAGARARMLLRALPREAAELPDEVIAHVLALAALEFNADPQEWEGALLDVCIAVNAAAAAPPSPRDLLFPSMRRAHARRAAKAPRVALLRRLVVALQLADL